MNEENQTVNSQPADNKPAEVIPATPDVAVETPEVPKKKGRGLVIGLIILIVVIAAGAVAYGFWNQPIHESNPINRGNPTNMSEASNYFAINLLRNSQSKQDNVFLSPLSINMALTLTANGAKGDTQKEMMSGQGFSQMSIEQVNQSLKSLMTDLKSDDSKEFIIANSLWFQNKYPIEQSFKDFGESEYSAEIRNVDFTNPTTADEINSWVSQKTNDKIKDIVDAVMIKNWVAAIANAVYFKSAWMNPFKKSMTADKTFVRENGSKVQVPMMSQKEYFPYYEASDYRIVELPYKDSNLGMLIILPKKNVKLADFLTSLNYKELANSIEKMKSKPVDLTMPKFKTEYKEDLKESLVELGMVLPFENMADFTAISREGLKIDTVIHKTYIDVDENGTEAAAATIVGMTALAMPQTKEPKYIKFNADHPFVYMIRDNSKKMNLFAGTMKNP